MTDLRILLLNILGYIACNFVIGVYSYWGPKVSYDIYNEADADITIHLSFFLGLLHWEGPISYVALHYVEPSLLPLAIAMCIASIHILADVPSSPLLGALRDYVNNWQETDHLAQR